MTLQIGYCTNVHAGATLELTRASLDRHACAVKERFSPRAPMGLGLWLSASSAGQMLREGGLPWWKAWLEDRGLVPFTLNGFPHGDFHDQVVKHRVYHPTWMEPARRDYTLDLITILDALLPPGTEGSISTVPLAWGAPPLRPAERAEAAASLLSVARHLARLEERTGRLIHLCLEPEPGCELQRSEDLVRFFEEHLLAGADAEAARRHLRVCHDVCHQVVMFEDQAEVLSRYRRAGIRVGKVQVSSAVCLSSSAEDAAGREAALEQLASFREERYLHQTMVRPAGGEPVFYQDLPEALAAQRGAAPGDEWRVHFHVPIYLETFGHLSGSQSAIRSCLDSLDLGGEVSHLEVETYAWGVLPPPLRQADLAEGIAAEMAWLRDAVAETPSR